MANPSPPSADRLELMQTFVRIVETGSLSAAAVQLGTTQPTVSRRLQTLERSLGLRLLQRSTHVMKLTEDGERCYGHAKDLLEQWQALEADLRGTTETPRGLLRVLVPHAFGQDQLIAPLTDYLHQYPGVSVEWLLHDRRPDLIAEGLDCAIQVGKIDDPSVIALRLAEVPRIVVAAPSLLGQAQAWPADRLAALPWLALRTFYRDSVTLTHCGDGREHQFSIRPRLSTDSLYALRRAALSGLGACLASQWILNEDLAAGRLVHLAPDWQAEPLPVYLVYPPARFYPAKLRAFIGLMRERMPHIVGMMGVAGSDARTPGA